MFWLNEPCTGTQPSCPDPSLTHASVKSLSPKGRIDGVRSLDGMTSPVCLMGVGMPLGSKFLHVFSPTCLWNLGDVGDCCEDSLDTLKAAHSRAPAPAATGRLGTHRCLFTFPPLFWGWMLSHRHAQRRCEPRGYSPTGNFSCPRCDADSFSCRFSLQLKKLLLSPSHVPPSCEAQRDGSARRPGTPKSRPPRPCTKVLPQQAELESIQCPPLRNHPKGGH